MGELMLMPKFDKQTSQLINKARMLGDSGIRIYLDDHVLLRICAVVATDLDKSAFMKEITSDLVLTGGYYSIPLEWFSLVVPTTINFVDIFLTLQKEIKDFPTYFANICELHKRRLKFKLILEQQAIAQIEQIVPR